MNKIAVKLLHVTTPQVIINALEKPYSNQGNVDIDLIKKVCLNESFQERHGSVLEHITLHFDITNFSRLELQEHSRHRIATETVESTRYVLNKLFKNLDEQDEDIFSPLFDIWKYFVRPALNVEEYSYLTEQQKLIFVDKQIALSKMSLNYLYQIYKGEGKRKDVDYSKYLLVEGFRTNMTWTINLRSFLNFLNLRTSNDAHFEIRYIANLCLQEANKTWLYEILGDYE